jgi:hypothetical protein
VNRTTLKRWINEYLDGEIGLAEKAEFERMMAEDPSLRREYKELRKIGLFLSYMPEVSVHPYRFRRKVLSALGHERGYFTPQRAFAGAMLVFLLVICLTFGLFMYQLGMLPGREFVLSQENLPASQVTQASYRFDLLTGVPAKDFLNRLALESQLGMAGSGLLAAFVSQTHVFEGAVCDPDGGLNQLVFAGRLPSSLIIRVTPQQAIALESLAGELSGQDCRVTATSPDGEVGGLRAYISSHPGEAQIPLHVVFK